MRDDGYAEGENGYAVAHHAPVAPLPRSLTTFSFRPVEVGNATRREIFVKLMRAAASVLKAALSAFSFGRVISSGPKVSGRLAPFCRRFQPLSLCDVVTMATQSIELELRENAPFGPWTGRCSQACRRPPSAPRSARIVRSRPKGCAIMPESRWRAVWALTRNVLLHQISLDDPTFTDRKLFK